MNARTGTYIKSDYSSYHSNLAPLVVRYSANFVIRGRNLHGTTIPLSHLLAAWKQFRKMISY